MIIEQPGIIDLCHEDYLKLDAINKSSLDKIAESPAHYRAWLEQPQDPTDAMLFGTAAHKIILEPELFDKSCVESPKFDRRTKQGKADAEAFELEHAGKIVLSSDQFEALRGMSESWLKHPLCKGIQAKASYEKTAIWVDPETNVQCKARADIVHADGMLLDLKTTDSAKREKFQRSIANFRYHVQAAWYLDGFTRATQTPVPFHSFIFIAIEKKAPYAISIFVADQQMVDIGRMTYREDLETFRRCKDTDNWPAYPTDIQPIELPHWAIA